MLAAAPLVAAAAASSGGLLALCWVAFKVGALSYGGGFVIIPLMQADAVDHYHWLTSQEFLNAVALGQITPGPVVHTVAVVGYGAAGRRRRPARGARRVLALVRLHPARRRALRPAPREHERRGVPRRARAPPPSGRSSAPRCRSRARSRCTWQYGVLAGAAVLLLVLRRGVVLTLLLAGAAGSIVALAGGRLPT